jgi:hypothetical protein
MASPAGRGELIPEILKTIAFFDLFDYPLTAFEVWQYLGVKADLLEVQTLLESAPGQLGRALENYAGFYFAGGRSGLYEKRQLTNRRIVAANHKARRIFSVLRFLPGVKLLAVCNNFYYTPASDIDVFVVTQTGRLYLTRFWLTVITQLLGARRHGKKISGRLCLSFYVSAEAADLRPLTLPDDPYFYYWLAFLNPIYSQNYFKEFWQANSWLLDILPNLVKTEALGKERLNPPVGILSELLKRLFDSRLGDSGERFWRFWQKRKMAQARREPAPLGGVVINDTVLKFHENDRRQIFAGNLQERWKSLLSL